jgi:CSLREA domain-containing protein
MGLIVFARIGAAILAGLIFVGFLALAPATGRASHAPFTVSSTADAPDTSPGDGACLAADATCTLRAAIEEANAHAGADTIGFAISLGPQTLAPASALPALTEAVTIDGTTQPGFAGLPLITVDGSTAGAEADGLRLAGDGSAVSGLVISGFSGAGIAIAGANNLVDGNTISANGGDGVSVQLAAGFGDSAGNSILGNSIYDNGGLGIDLGPEGPTPNDAGDGDSGGVAGARGPNDLQNYPLLNSVSSVVATTSVSGTLNSESGSEFVLEVFVSSGCDPSSHGEGETLLGTTTTVTNSQGNATFGGTFNGAVLPGQVVTATATGPGGSTSEFSPCIGPGLPGDADGDTVLDGSDNCQSVYNPEQTNSDRDNEALPYRRNGALVAGDDLGNACDPDDDNDGFGDSVENNVGTSAVLPCGANAWPADLSGNQVVDFTDMGAMIPSLFTVSSLNPRYDLMPSAEIDVSDMSAMVPHLFLYCALGP